MFPHSFLYGIDAISQEIGLFSYLMKPMQHPSNNMKFSRNAVALLASTGAANAALLSKAALFPRYTLKGLVPITILVGSVTTVPALGIKPDVEDGPFDENRLRSGAVSSSKVDSLFETSLVPPSRHLTSLDGSWVPLGSPIVGEAADDHSGWSVSLSGDGTRVAIGAYDNDANGSNSGHVQIFTFEEASESPSVEPSESPSFAPKTKSNKRPKATKKGRVRRTRAPKRKGKVKRHLFA